jgi:hypothetical protein
MASSVVTMGLLSCDINSPLLLICLLPLFGVESRVKERSSPTHLVELYLLHHIGVVHQNPVFGSVACLGQAKNSVILSVLRYPPAYSDSLAEKTHMWEARFQQ